MQPTLSMILDEAADIISRPQSWTRGEDAKPSPHSPCGTRFCLRGAMRQAIDNLGVYVGDRHTAFDTCMNVVQQEIDRSYPLPDLSQMLHRGTGLSVTGWNDEQRDKRKVVRLLRRTARRQRAGQV